MLPLHIDLVQASHKKIYEMVLSAKEPSEQLAFTLQHLIKHSLSCSQHFGFLLHRINWFEPPFTSYREQLMKIFRLYRACRRQSSRVIYNLVIEGFFNPKSYTEALNCLVRVFSETNDHQNILAALKENYPHKLCTHEIHSFYLANLLKLAQTFPRYRTDLLQIAIENLVKFDTEILLGDDWVHRPFPNDRKILEGRQAAGKNELATKLDDLLVQLLNYLIEVREDTTILNEILLIFQNKVLPIKTTKAIQMIIFYLAEQSRPQANSFISFLLANIFENQQQQNWYRIFAQSNFYLSSYLLRSKTVSSKTLLKTFLLLVQRLSNRLLEIDEETMDQKIDLKHILQQRELPLLILQSIIMIKIGNPSLDRPDLNQLFEKLLQQSDKKLHYHFFLRPEILEKIHQSSHSSTHLRLKFSNKFLPSTLGKTGDILDPFMRISIDQEKEEWQQLAKYVPGDEERKRSEDQKGKIHKGDTPMSYCSQTVI